MTTEFGLPEEVRIEHDADSSHIPVLFTQDSDVAVTFEDDNIVHMEVDIDKRKCEESLNFDAVAPTQIEVAPKAPEIWPIPENRIVYDRFEPDEDILELFPAELRDDLRICIVLAFCFDCGEAVTITAKRLAKVICKPFNEHKPSVSFDLDKLRELVKKFEPIQDKFNLEDPENIIDRHYLRWLIGKRLAKPNSSILEYHSYEEQLKVSEDQVRWNISGSIYRITHCVRYSLPMMFRWYTDWLTEVNEALSEAIKQETPWLFEGGTQ